MKILHVCEYVRGGITTYVNEIVSYQVASPEISSVSVLMSRFNSDQLSAKGIQTYYYNYKRNLFQFPSAIIQVNRAIHEINPDIIHVHSSFAGLFVRTCFFFQRKRPKIIYCAHGWSFLMDISPLKKHLYGFLERMLARKTDRIINISNKEFAGSQKYRLPGKKSIIIPNGIAEQPSVQQPISLPLSTSTVNLLFVGRFDRQKGIDILIDYFNSHPMESIRLYVIGDHVLQTIQTRIPEQIVWLGWVDHRVIDNYYQPFDAVIIPSRWEGFGLVAIEAMKNKKAVIASNRGALPELVHHGVNGYLFDLDHLNGLTSILTTLNKQTLRTMGERGFKYYKQYFTSEKLNQRLIDVYEQLLDVKENATATQKMAPFDAVENQAGMISENR